MTDEEMNLEVMQDLDKVVTYACRQKDLEIRMAGLRLSYAFNDKMIRIYVEVQEQA